MDPAPAMSLEQLAAVMARMEAGLPREHAIASAGLDEQTFRTGQEAWLARMAEQAQRQSFALHQRYTDLLAVEREIARQEARARRSPAEGGLPVAPAARLSPIAAFASAGPAPAASRTAEPPRAAPPMAQSSLPFRPPSVPEPIAPPVATQHGPVSAPAFWQAISSPNAPSPSSRRTFAALPFRPPASEAIESKAPSSLPIAAAPPPGPAERPAPPPPNPAERAVAPAPIQAERAVAPHPGQAERPAATLEQLAWLHVQLEATPHAADAARAQLGIDASAQARAEAIWRAAFREDVQLYAHYERCVRYYRGVRR